MDSLIFESKDWFFLKILVVLLTFCVSQIILMNLSELIFRMQKLWMKKYAPDKEDMRQIKNE